MNPRTGAASTALARSLALSYTLLVVYASLHPFTGWRDSGVALFAFLQADWPRYITLFDLSVNVLAYVPLGFLWYSVLLPRCGRGLATLLVCVGAALLSGTLETVQNFLPSRVPSHVDLACNAIGGLLGALIAQRHGRSLLSEGRLQQWRQRHIADEPHGDYGLVLLGLWLLMQLSPENLLFGSGNLRQLLGLPSAMPFDADSFNRLEGLIATCGTLGACLLLTLVLRAPRFRDCVLLMVAAVLLRTFSAALLIGPAQSLHWLTFGNAGGLAFGLGLAWLAFAKSAGLRCLLAALAIMATCALVNLTPDNPYLLQAAQVWQPGHFLNFNGATRLAGSLWPFLAIAFLMSGRRQLS